MNAIILPLLIIIQYAFSMQEGRPYKAHCKDGTITLSEDEWNLLVESSDVIQHASDFHDGDDQEITLPAIETSVLQDITCLLKTGTSYNSYDFNRMYKLIFGALYTHEKYPYKVNCRNGIVNLSEEEWSFLTKSSKLMKGNPDFYDGDDQEITLANIKISTLKNILHPLKTEKFDYCHYLNHMHKLLLGVSYLNINLQKMTQIISSLKQLLASTDITDPIAKEILFSDYAWENRKVLNAPTTIVPCIKTLKSYGSHSRPIIALQMWNNHLISASVDKTIKIWNPHSDECVRILEGHASKVAALAICNKNILASGSSDRTIKLWDLASYTCIKTLQGHIEDINTLEKTCDNLLISGSADKTIKLWDLSSDQCIQTLQGHSGWVGTLVMCHEKTFASGSTDNTIKLWDLNSGKCIKTLQSHTKGIRALYMFDANTLVSGSADNTIKIWDLCSDQLLKTLEGHTNWINALTGWKNFLLSASADHSIKIWDLNNNQLLNSIEGHDGNGVNALSLCTENILASGSADKTIKLWDISVLDSEKYTPPQNALMRTLFEYKDDKAAQINILHDKEWKKVYDSLPSFIPAALNIKISQSKKEGTLQ